MDDSGSGSESASTLSFVLPSAPSSYASLDGSHLTPRVTHRSSPATAAAQRSATPPLQHCHDGSSGRQHRPSLVAQLRRRGLRLAAGLSVVDAVLLALVILLPCFLLRQIYLHDSDASAAAGGSTGLDGAVAALTPAWETTHDLSVHYHLVLLDLLPYADGASDSGGTSVSMRGRYSDATSFTYPLCSFTRVCLTSSHVLLSFANLSVHTFYERTLPYCRDRLYRRFSVCGCFHNGYRPAVLPYALAASDDDLTHARRVAQRMIDSRFGAGEQWTRDSVAADERVVPAAQEIPTVDEMAVTTHSAPRRYADPFIAPAESSSGPFQFRYFPSHYYSIHKWVSLHHIAHWAQKLLVMQATLGHFHHACRHTYARTLPDQRAARSTSSSRAETEELVEQPLRRADGRYSPLPYRVECLPELSGVVCHDTYSPLYEHEENIMDISVHALSDWVDSLGDDVSAHRPAASALPEKWLPLNPALPAEHSLPAAFSPSFSHSSSVLFTNDLYTVYSAEYLGDMEKWNRQLPSPESVRALSCFARVSFSPLFGTFVDNAYDAQQWRKRAMRHYELKEHRTHSFAEVSIPPAPHTAEPSQQQSADAAGQLDDRRLLALPVLAAAHDGDVAATPSSPAAASAATPSSHSYPSITHSASAAIGLSSCPPSSAVLIYRPDRSILNQGELLSLLKAKYNLLLHPTAVDGSTSSFEQARIFASAGLILSPHSSQLVNVMFAHSSAAVVEVTGEFYNLDFARYATSMGVYFRYAIGGSFPQAHQPPDPLMADCVRELHQCAGDNWCIGARAVVHCKQNSFFPNKNLPYYANLTAVDIAVRHALSHVLKHCYGKWQDVRLATV